MKVIPDYVAKYPSNAEKKVAQLLKGVQIDGVALHSLNVPRHPKKRFGEIDFFLVTSFGILGLEVKGHKLLRKDGVWIQRDINTGSERQLSESPFDQVRSAFYQVSKELRERNIPHGNMGWGVVTPDCVSLPDSLEFSQIRQSDVTNCRTSGKFNDWISKLIVHWKGHQGGRNIKSLTPKEVETVVQHLRPDFELAIPLGQRTSSIKEQRNKFTKEQIERIDEIAENPRILCRGGAGTGKTFLAVEVLRRESCNNKSAVYVARNQPLIDHLRAHLSQCEESYDVLSFNELRQKADSGHQWEVLVVDEGQDMLSEEHLKVLESALIGGLANGRWRWFMDDYHQAGFYNDLNPEVTELLTDNGVSLQRLVNNCRNTREIIQFTQSVTGADIGKAKLNGIGKPPEEIFHPRGEAARSTLKVVGDWISQEVPEGEIVVLTCDDEVDHEIESLLPKGVKFKSVLDYKGQESTCVCLCGLPVDDSVEEIANKLYTGLTRACVDLCVVIPKSLQDSWDNTKFANLSKIIQEGTFDV